MRITHKQADGFIRKYNQHFSIKNYSKMKLETNIKAIDSHTSRIGGAVKADWGKKRQDAMRRPNRGKKKKYNLKMLFNI